MKDEDGERVAMRFLFLVVLAAIGTALAGMTANAPAAPWQEDANVVAVTYSRVAQGLGEGSGFDVPGKGGFVQVLRRPADVEALAHWLRPGDRTTLVAIDYRRYVAVAALVKVGNLPATAVVTSLRLSRGVLEVSVDVRSRPSGGVFPLFGLVLDTVRVPRAAFGLTVPRQARLSTSFVTLP